MADQSPPNLGRLTVESRILRPGRGFHAILLMVAGTPRDLMVTTINMNRSWNQGPCQVISLRKSGTQHVFTVHGKEGVHPQDIAVIYDFLEFKEISHLMLWTERVRRRGDCNRGNTRLLVALRATTRS